MTNIGTIKPHALHTRRGVKTDSGMWNNIVLPPFSGCNVHFPELVPNLYCVYRLCSNAMQDPFNTRNFHNVCYVNVRYSRKYWWELNLAVEFQITITNILVRLKFGGSPLYARKKFWRIFYLVVERPTAKPSNLNYHQIFRLYGTYRVMTFSRES